MFRRLTPTIGLFAAWFFAGSIFVLSAAPARAQVNIDQGKSAAEIFSNDCGTCHKTAKGLANGKNSATLTGFLREHYTSSAQQAGSLAAYVLGAGSGPPFSASLKPGTGEPKAGEVKTGEAKSGEAKNGEAKPGEKAVARPGRPEPSSTAKLQQPDQDTKIEAEPATEPGPAAGRKPAGKHEPRTASRGPKQEPETPTPAPQAAPIATPETAPVATAPATTAPAAAPVTTEPSAPAAAEPPPATTAAAPSAVPESSPAASAATPSPETDSSTSAAAPAEAPSDSAPVPRDDIPD